jgi:hypothetical protein
MATTSKYQLDIFKDDLDGFKRCASELSAREKKTIQDALAILESTLRTPGAALTSPDLVADYGYFCPSPRKGKSLIFLILRDLLTYCFS